MKRSNWSGLRRQRPCYWKHNNNSGDSHLTVSMGGCGGNNNNNKTEITIDVIVHATEDVTKFYGSFGELFGVGEEQFAIEELAGHYDNPITLLRAKITTEAGTRRIIEKISSELSRGEKEEVLESLDKRMDGSSLYMRLDKQRFVQGRIALEEGNAVKLKIYTPVYRKKEIVQAYQTLLGFN